MAKLVSLISFASCLALSAAQDPSSQPIKLEQSTLNFSSASPHIFASLFGLLQQWPNTFVPYGHSIVPCEISINTNLYHARIDSDLPSSPEWFGFDAAMSYSIAGTLSTSHLLTYRTTRNVKCIYFDGTSAALNGAGNMDSQMVLIHNNSANVPDDPVFGGPSNNRTSGDPNGPMLGAEYGRAEGLCAFIRDNNLGGRGWGYEGIVRMNAGFEVIWCDFESPSVRLVSRFNTSVPSFKDKDSESAPLQTLQGRRFPGLVHQEVLENDDRRPHGPPGWRSGSFHGSARLGWLIASVNQYGFAGTGMPGRGEVRVKPDCCGIWSFYDPGLADQERARLAEEHKTLNISESGIWTSPVNESDREAAIQLLQRRRRSHRANHVSKRDGLYMRDAIKQRLRASLEPLNNNCSSIDWHQISEETMLGYSSTLLDLLGLLKSMPLDLEDDREMTRKWIVPVRELIHLMMMPYYEYPTRFEVETSPQAAFSLGSPQALAAYQRCKDQSLPVDPGDLAHSEELAYSAVVDVLENICRVILSTFLTVEEIWYSTFDTPSTKEMSQEIGEQGIKWHKDVEELMAWLGWADQWTGCSPGCGTGELCWIPMWPLSFMTRPPGDEMHEPSKDSLQGPPSGRWPPYGGPRGPGYGHRGPPGFGGGDEKMLWEPQCLNRTQMLLDLVD